MRTGRPPPGRESAPHWPVGGGAPAPPNPPILPAPLGRGTELIATAERKTANRPSSEASAASPPLSAPSSPWSAATPRRGTSSCVVDDQGRPTSALAVLMAGSTPDDTRGNTVAATVGGRRDGVGATGLSATEATGEEAHGDSAWDGSLSSESVSVLARDVPRLPPQLGWTWELRAALVVERLVLQQLERLPRLLQLLRLLWLPSPTNKGPSSASSVVAPWATGKPAAVNRLTSQPLVAELVGRNGVDGTDAAGSEASLLAASRRPPLTIDGGASHPSDTGAAAGRCALRW